MLFAFHDENYDVTVTLEFDPKEPITYAQLKQKLADALNNQKDFKLNKFVDDLSEISINKIFDYNTQFARADYKLREETGVEGHSWEENAIMDHHDVRRFFKGDEIQYEFNGPYNLYEKDNTYKKDNSSPSANKIVLTSNNLLPFLDEMADQFIIENTKFTQELKNINFSSLDPAERIAKENNAMKKISQSWHHLLEDIISPILETSLPNKNEIVWLFINKLLEKVAELHAGKKLELVFVWSEKSRDRIIPDTEVVRILKTMVDHAEKNDKSIDSEKEVQDKCYLFLPKSVRDLLGASEEANFICNTKIDELSFLHHWSTGIIQETDFEGEVVPKAVNIVKSFPNAEKIVLRGCGTAGELENTAPFEKYKIVVVGNKTNLETFEPEEDAKVILFQQKKEKQKIDPEHPKIVTTLKFRDPVSKKVETLSLTLPENKAGSKLSYEMEIEIAKIASKYNLPLIDFQDKKTNQFQQNIRKDWLSGNTVTKENKKILKASERRARTVKVREFPALNSFARALQDGLTKLGIKKEIKAYVEAYSGHTAGSFGEMGHDQNKYPKAIKM